LPVPETTTSDLRPETRPEMRYVSRVARLPLVDGDGATIGQVSDVVLAPAGRSAPKVLGFITSVQRRQIFVNANRIGDIDATGVRMRVGSIDVRPFRKRRGELLALGDIVGEPVRDLYVLDVGIAPTDAPSAMWELTTLALGGRGPLARRRNPTIVPWTEAPELLDGGADTEKVA
jgi:sporulation protein YlmC with PRC-barrel domain